jgi:predicted nucleotidyltransferase
MNEDSDIRVRLRKGHRETRVTELMAEAAQIIDVLVDMNFKDKIKCSLLEDQLRATQALLETYRPEPI